MGAGKEPGMDRKRASAGRLRALAGSGLLDSCPIPGLDRLTERARALLRVSTSFITLLDARRDVLKSCAGLPATAPRELAHRTLGELTLRSAVPVVVADAAITPKHRSTSTAQQLGIRAYVAAPMAAAGGEVIGAFCIGEFAPRDWTLQEVDLVCELAHSAMREVDLHALTRGIEGLQLDARELDLRRERVLAGMEHDLRNPLNVILSGSEFLAQQEASAPRVKLLNLVRNAAQDIERLVRDFRELLRLGTVEPLLELGAVDVAQMLQAAVASSAPAAERAGVRLLCEPAPGLPPVSGDAGLLQRALAHLIANALRASGAGEEVRVVAEGLPDGIRVSVRDRGSGLETQEAAEAFDRFSTHRRAARGVGLALVRQIVEAHGGQVGVDSTPGKGSTFHFTLPA